MLNPITDSDWKRLVSTQSVDSAKKQADEHLQQLQLSSDQLEYLRWRAKSDSFYLGRSVLGYKKFTETLHGNISQWLYNTRQDQFRIILLPRSYFKTTQVTITGSIQLALPDVRGDLDYIGKLGPNIRILLAHESHTGASRFLFEISRHFLANPKLMALFPECIPDRRFQRINQHELELPRDTFFAEPTFDTMGVGGLSQGRHYDVINLDDIFGDKARDSKAERETTIQWFDNIQSFFIDLSDSKLNIIGTRYSLDDVYGHALKVYEGQIMRYIRRIEEADTEGNVYITFPEKFNEKNLRILRQNPKTWIQYSNHPTEGFTEFEAGWKRFYTKLPGDKISVQTGNHTEIVNIKDCDIVILFDPARTGKNGIVVTAEDTKGRIFVIESIKGRYKDPEVVNLLFKLVQRWWPRCLAIEEVLFSGLYKPWLESEMQLRGVRFYVMTVRRKRIPSRLGAHDESKPDHIKILANYFSAGLIYFHLSQQNLIDEYDSFGASEDIHLLDALAYGPQVWRPGWSMRKINENLQTVDDMEDRDVMTGYSI